MRKSAIITQLPNSKITSTSTSTPISYNQNINNKQQNIHKYVMITGCTDGIGKQYAIYFNKLGYSLILIARNTNKLNTLIE